MQTAQLIPFVGIALAVLIVALLARRYIVNRRAEKKARIVDYTGDRKNHLYFLYKVYIKTPILKRYFSKVVSRLETLYPADTVAIRSKATNDFTIALAVAFICLIVLGIFGRGDIFFIGVGIVLTYVLFTQVLNSRIERLEEKLNLQFSDFLTDVRHYYHDTNNVVDAVFNTLDDIPYELGLHINKIYQILLSTHTEEEVGKYTDIAPNRFLMMFAAICATIKEYGDKRLEDGQWLYLKNLNHIKDELNIEILKNKKNNFLFRGFKFIAVSPVFLLKPIELWAESNMPEMASFYTGGAGTIAVAIIFAIAIACYQLISNLKDGRVDEMKENALLIKLAGLPVIRGLLTAEINRNYTKSLRTGDNLKIVGETIGPKEFLLKRVFYGIAFFIAFNIVVVFAQAQKKNSVLTDFKDSYEQDVLPNQEFRESMRVFSANYVAEMKKLHSYDIDRNELADRISEEQGIRWSYASIAAEEIINRLARYREVYYKWYLLMCSVLAGVFGFFVPWLLLQYQLSIMRMSMEDEVIQYQTLALILMYVDGITLDVILEWMERFAFCFKASISECIINLEYSEEKALTKMKNSEPFPPFKRFCDNLLSIDSVGIVSAFEEIESEREFYKKKREQDNEEILEKKSSRGKLICMVPIYVTVGGYLIFPFMQMAMSMMGTMGTALNGAL